MGLRTDVASSLPEIDALGPQWSALERATPEATGFQSFAWCRAWLDAAAASGTPAQPRIATVREDGHLVMLWPLQIESYFGARVARWIGEPLTQYGDVLALDSARRAAWRVAAEAEFARWRDVDLLAFTRLRADAALTRTGTALDTAAEILSAPFIDLDVAANAPRRHRSLERRVKRLAAYGPLRLERVEEPERRAEAARTALTIKREWLRSRGLYSASLSNPAAAHTIEMLCRSGFLRVHCLWAGDKRAAIEIGFVGGGAYRSLLGCFDAELAEGSPGHSLTLAMQRLLAAEGISRLDFLAPSDAYKMLFANGAAHVGGRFVAHSWRGHVAAFTLARLRPQAKRLAKQLAEISLQARRRPLWPASAFSAPKQSLAKN
jgi:CelD/BcsL family acetyltransferase involved in cellulose biosynthesis